MEQNTDTSSHKNQLGIAACLFPIDQGLADNAVQLFPSGEFTAPEGALMGEGPWHIDSQLASTVVAALAENDNILIDYDHQSLLFTKNHKPLDVAGTFSGSQLEWQESSGLFAKNVDWAAAAKDNFSKGKFLYISPLFTYDKSSGAVKQLISVAVTDNPAIKNMRAIELAAASLITPPEEENMNKELMILLGLSDTATDEEVMAACKALQTSAKSVETLTNELAALKAKTESGAPDPNKWVPIDVLKSVRAELSALSVSFYEKEQSDLLAAAKGLTAKEIGYAKTLDLETLKNYLEVTEPLAALKGTQTEGKQLDKDGLAVLSTDQLAVCSQMGIDPKEYQATLAEQE